MFVGPKYKENDRVVIKEYDLYDIDDDRTRTIPEQRCVIEKVLSNASGYMYRVRVMDVIHTEHKNKKEEDIKLDYRYYRELKLDKLLNG